MPNPLGRLSLELSQLKGCLSPKDYRRYVGALAKKGLAVVRQRTLVPADHAMSGQVPFTIAGKTVILPLDEIRASLEGHDQTPTFGGAREMYASNVYLRAFNTGLRAHNIVDLGSNRGLFLALGAKVLGAERGVGVEPQEFYAPGYAALLNANSMAAHDFPRVYKFVSATARTDSVTMRQIMADHDMETIHFLKCDIEGGEFDVFLSNNDFLGKVNNIAMELHPSEGDVTRLVEVLQQYGFEFRITDQFDQSIAPQKGHYLYASRDGSLAST